MINISKYVALKRDGKRIDEHRLIWIQNYGLIPKGYIVHHKDENKSNNVLSNLELMTRNKHTKLHRPQIKLTAEGREKLVIAANKQWKEKLSHIPDGYSECNICKKVLPLSYFNKDKYRKRGVYSCCKNCRKTIRKS